MKFFQSLSIIRRIGCNKVSRATSCLCIFGLFNPACIAGEQKETPYVTCDLKGALGNQLFQIATTLAYAWDYGATAVFPGLHRSEYGCNYNRDKIFFRLDTSNPPRPFVTSYTEIAWNSSEKIPFQWDQFLNGYFQTWTRFDHYRDRLLEVFAPSEEQLAFIMEKYGELISHPLTVSVHVRTFNSTLHHSRYHPFMGLEYYRKAMEHYPQDALFVVFSDRINWCKKHFPELGRNFVFIEGNDPISDLHLMSMMKHHIIANSSFSWWGVYLNRHPDKIVIAPTSMMHPDFYPFPLKQPNELYLPDWILVSPDYSAPYPEDMTHYDVTTSLDGN